jgi:hypothetical protein
MRNKLTLFALLLPSSLLFQSGDDFLQLQFKGFAVFLIIHSMRPQNHIWLSRSDGLVPAHSRVISLSLQSGLSLFVYEY